MFKVFFEEIYRLLHHVILPDEIRDNTKNVDLESVKIECG